MLAADIQIDFSGGQDDFRAPAVLGISQYARGVNVCIRSGTPKTRDRYVWTPLAGGDATGMATGKFQGAIDIGNGAHMVAVSGHLYRAQTRPGRRLGTEASVRRLTSPDLRLDQYVDRIYMATAGLFVVAQDGHSKPIVVDSTGRASKSETVPVGRDMLEVNGRLFLVTKDRDSVRASRIWTCFADCEEILKFDEVPDYLVPYDIGEIRALSFLPVIDSSTGMGPLLALGERGAYSWQVDLPRDQWGLQQFGRKVLAETEAAGPHVVVGSDIYFRTTTDVTTLQYARADYSSLSSAPFGQPVHGWIGPDSHSPFLALGTVAASNRYVRWAIRPTIFPGVDLAGDAVMDYRHNAILVLDVAHQRPTWVGVETGLYPVAVLVSGGWTWVWSRDNDGQLRLYRIDDEVSGADVGPNGRVRQACSVETRGMTAQDPTTMKRLSGRSSVDVSQVKGMASAELFHRGDHYPKWSTISGHRIDGAKRNTPASRRIGFRFRDEEFSAITRRSTRVGAYQQARITWCGEMAIDRVRMIFETTEPGTHDPDQCEDFDAACDACGEDPIKISNPVA